MTDLERSTMQTDDLITGDTRNDVIKLVCILYMYKFFLCHVWLSFKGTLLQKAWFTIGVTSMSFSLEMESLFEGND